MTAPICQIDTGGDRSGHVGNFVFTDQASGIEAVPVVAELGGDGTPTGVLRANGSQISAGGEVIAAGGRSVKLLSALRGIVGAFDGEAVHVAAHDNNASYYTRFPAGGGVFVWDAGSTHLDDNAMTIAPAAGGGRWKRQFSGFVVTPEMFGAVGNSNWMNETTGVWYQDQALTIPAADDTAALNAWLTFLSQRAYRYCMGFMSRWYLVDGTVTVPDAPISLVGTGMVQTGSRTGAALCAGRAVSSVRQSSNAWSNPVLYVSNRTSLSGGGVLRDFSVIGTSAGFGTANAISSWADRAGIQFHFALNKSIYGVSVMGFKKACMSFVASQDIPLTACWLYYGGTDDGTNWHPALEFLNDPTDNAGGLIAGTNAIHFTGLRHEACKAFMHFSNGTSNLGEIHFVSSKIESVPGWTFESTPIRVASGFGAISFGSGSNYRFPTCMTASGTQVYVFDVRAYSTKFDGCKWFGGSQFLYHNDIRGLDLDDVIHENANPALFSFWILFNGRVGNFKRLDLFVSGSSTRNGIRLGKGCKVKGIHFGQVNDPFMDQSAGQLIRMDASESVDTLNAVDGVTIDENQSAGYKNYATLAATGSASASTMRRNTVKRTESLVGAGDSLIDGSGAVDAAGCHHVVFDAPTTAKTIGQMKNGYIGQRCALAVTSANAGNVTVANSANIILSSGADIVLSSASKLVELVCLDGAVWREA